MLPGLWRTSYYVLPYYVQVRYRDGLAAINTETVVVTETVRHNRTTSRNHADLPEPRFRAPC